MHTIFVLFALGSGKTLAYALIPPSLSHLFGGPRTVLVISPLLALMTDQVRQVSKLGVTATYLGSTQTDKSMPGQVVDGKYQVVFVSPEFVQGRFRPILKSMKDIIGAVVVDEAHCIETW